MKNNFFFVWAGAWILAVIHVWRPEESGTWKLAVLATAYFFFLLGWGFYISVTDQTGDEKVCGRKMGE